MPARLQTAYSELEWSPDGTRVTKRRPVAHDARRRFRNELRVNRMLRAMPPPVHTPVLLDFDVQSRRLTFEAVDGEPLGPKYPADLAPADVDAIVELTRALTRYDPPRRRLRRFDAVACLRLAARRGVLDDTTATRLEPIARRHHQLHFAHGDATARNVLRTPTGTVLIDWEWAGLYPEHYDAAFLWYSLREVAGGRARVERSVTTDPKPFFLCALLVELWHLQWYVTDDYRAAHLADRDALVDRLL